jgi:hypothetical protein
VSDENGNILTFDIAGKFLHLLPNKIEILLGKILSSLMLLKE